MSGEGNSRMSMANRLVREPMVHFLFLGALLFGIEHMLSDDARVITVSPGLAADLDRRFRDEQGRAPDPGERSRLLRDWKRDEALYQEALRRGLDRDDATIRRLLVEKMLAEAALQVPVATPTDKELDAWLEAHRTDYELPLRYHFEFFVFTRAETNRDEELDEAFSSLQAGTSPRELGRTLTGANLTSPQMRGRLAPRLAQAIPELPPGKWVRLAGEDESWLLRVKAVTGGLPPRAEIRERLIADWTLAKREEATARRVDETVNLYRFEVQE